MKRKTAEEINELENELIRTRFINGVEYTKALREAIMANVEGVDLVELEANDYDWKYWAQFKKLEADHDWLAMPDDSGKLTKKQISILRGYLMPRIKYTKSGASFVEIGILRAVKNYVGKYADKEILSDLIIAFIGKLLLENKYYTFPLLCIEIKKQYVRLYRNRNGMTVTGTIPKGGRFLFIQNDYNEEGDNKIEELSGERDNSIKTKGRKHSIGIEVGAQSTANIEITWKHPLNSTEKDVVELFKEGYTNQEVIDKLNITSGYLYVIRNKLKKLIRIKYL